MRNKPAPPAKWVIRDRLLAYLYEPVDALRQQELAGLIERNVVLLQQKDMALHKRILPEHFHRSFAYNGEFYSLEHAADPGPPVRNRLQPQLEAEMSQFAAYYGVALVEEKMLVGNYLNSVLAWSQAPGDWLQVLPYSMHEPMKGMVSTPDWDPTKIPEEAEAFMVKYKIYFDKIRQRMAINLIL